VPIRKNGTGSNSSLCSAPPSSLASASHIGNETRRMMVAFFLFKERVMKSKFLIAALACTFVGAALADERKVPTTPSEKMGYAVGAEFATKFKNEKFEFDSEMAVQGMRDAFANNLQMNRDEVEFVLKSFQAELRRKIAANRQMAALTNNARNQKFFDDNKKAEGVVALSSGVQYKILKAGDGPKPTDASTVTANYRGTLLDGTEFDKTVEGKPAKLKVAGLIQGWRVALSAMPAGSRWQVWIPSVLAYGERGHGAIGPQEPLVFDIELLSIDK
jgi:FKBP-type peptidyl-prolyl cis-trans isomerase FklB